MLQASEGELTTPSQAVIVHGDEPVEKTTVAWGDDSPEAVDYYATWNAYYYEYGYDFDGIYVDVAGFGLFSDYYIYSSYFYDYYYDWFYSDGDIPFEAFSGTGNHIYAAAGDYTVGTTIDYEGPDVVEGTASESVAAAPIDTLAVLPKVNATVAASTSTLGLVNFAADSPFDVDSEYTATVPWGDGGFSFGNGSLPRTTERLR